jgi:hypothetical protein
VTSGGRSLLNSGRSGAGVASRPPCRCGCRSPNFGLVRAVSPGFHLSSNDASSPTSLCSRAPAPSRSGCLYCCFLPLSVWSPSPRFAHDSLGCPDRCRPDNGRLSGAAPFHVGTTGTATLGFHSYHPTVSAVLLPCSVTSSVTTDTVGCSETFAVVSDHVSARVWPVPVVSEDLMSSGAPSGLFP